VVPAAGGVQADIVNLRAEGKVRRMPNPPPPPSCRQNWLLEPPPLPTVMREPPRRPCTKGVSLVGLWNEKRGPKR